MTGNGMGDGGWRSKGPQVGLEHRVTASRTKSSHMGQALYHLGKRDSLTKYKLILYGFYTV